MSQTDGATVRRFYEEMNNGRHNELASDLFTADHRFHFLQQLGVVPTAEAAKA